MYSTTRRDGSLYGSGRSSTAFVTLKIAVLAPIPSAIVSAAVSVKTGLRRSVRNANARSCIIPAPYRAPTPAADPAARRCVPPGGHRLRPAVRRHAARRDQRGRHRGYHALQRTGAAPLRLPEPLLLRRRGPVHSLV